MSNVWHTQGTGQQVSINGTEATLYPLSANALDLITPEIEEEVTEVITGLLSEVQKMASMQVDNTDVQFSAKALFDSLPSLAPRLIQLLPKLRQLAPVLIADAARDHDAISSIRQLPISTQTALLVQVYIITQQDMLKALGLLDDSAKKKGGSTPAASQNTGNSPLTECASF